MTGRLFDHLAAHAGRPLFQCDDGQTIPYQSALELAADPALRDTRRQLVLCLCDNEPGALLGYLGLLGAGAVPLMLAAAVPGPQLSRLLAAYRPAFVWLPQARAREIPAATLVLSTLNHCLLATGDGGDVVLHESLALLLGTSGSTGSPKFVRLSHENVLANAQAIAGYLEITPDERPITTLPPSYTYGLSVLHSHVLRGSAIAVTSKTFFDRGFWDFVAAVRATSLAGVPYHYDMLRRLRFASMDLPALRTLTQAGGRMDPAVTREFATHCAARGMRWFSMYGQAEATARMAWLPPARALDKPASIGGPIPGGRFWLEDEARQVQQDPEAAGQLVYQGPNVALGYAHGLSDLACGDEFGGVLRTGDLARRDAEGDYYIVGRLSRFLKLFGHRVNLQDVEEELLSAGYTAACAGRDDQLEVFVAPEAHASARLIKTRLVTHLRVPAHAVRVLGVDRLPRSEGGKVRYVELDAVERAVLA
jgi:long-chain acyl-CoA synthetase